MATKSSPVYSNVGKKQEVRCMPIAWKKVEPNKIVVPMAASGIVSVLKHAVVKKPFNKTTAEPTVVSRPKRNLADVKAMLKKYKLAAHSDAPKYRPALQNVSKAHTRASPQTITTVSYNDCDGSITDGLSQHIQHHY